jgi:hypothetical protein
MATEGRLGLELLVFTESQLTESSAEVNRAFKFGPWNYLEKTDREVGKESERGQGLLIVCNGISRMSSKSLVCNIVRKFEQNDGMIVLLWLT